MMFLLLLLLEDDTHTHTQILYDTFLLKISIWIEIKLILWAFGNSKKKNERNRKKTLRLHQLEFPIECALGEKWFEFFLQCLLGGSMLSLSLPLFLLGSNHLIQCWMNFGFIFFSGIKTKGIIFRILVNFGLCLCSTLKTWLWYCKDFYIKC